MQLRAPSIAPGVSAFVWAFAFALYVWAFLLGIGASEALAAPVGALTLGGVFLYVRTRGIHAHPPRRRARRT